MSAWKPFAATLSGALAILGFGAGAAVAQDPSVALVDLYQGSSLSDLARGLSNGGYELQDGTWVSFDKWYRTDWVDLHADVLIALSEDAGLLWGIGTGEQGEKYKIDPSVTLGFVGQVHPRPQASLSLTMSTVLGGAFTELPCMADYGEIGGVQEVNCRLAAGVLQPSETLKYLVKADPSRLHIALSYHVNF